MLTALKFLNVSPEHGVFGIWTFLTVGIWVFWSTSEFHGRTVKNTTMRAHLPEFDSWLHLVAMSLNHSPPQFHHPFKIKKGWRIIAHTSDGIWWWTVSDVQEAPSVCLLLRLLSLRHSSLFPGLLPALWLFFIYPWHVQSHSQPATRFPRPENHPGFLFFPK